MDKFDEMIEQLDKIFEYEENKLEKFNSFLNKSKVYIKHGKKVPEGVTIERGKRGGEYYRTVYHEKVKTPHGRIPEELDVFDEIAPGIKSAKREKNQTFGKCYLNSLNYYKNTGNPIVVGITVDMYDMKRALETDLDKFFEANIYQTLHAWNLDKKGRVVDTSFGSKIANEHFYYGKIIPKKVNTEEEITEFLHNTINELRQKEFDKVDEKELERQYLKWKEKRNTLEKFNDWIRKEKSIPPRPGLTFDRQKHRWVRTDSSSPGSIEQHAIHDHINSIVHDNLNTKNNNMNTYVGDFVNPNIESYIDKYIDKADQLKIVRVVSAALEFPKEWTVFNNILGTYAKIANPDVDVPDDEINKLSDLLIRQKKKLSDWNNELREYYTDETVDEFEKNTNKVFNEIKYADTRSERIISIDKLISMAHMSEKSLIPALSGYSGNKNYGAYTELGRLSKYIFDNLFEGNISKELNIVKGINTEFINSLLSLDFILKEQATPPHPGLVFDRTKHRWIRPSTTKPHREDYVAERKNMIKTLKSIGGEKQVKYEELESLFTPQTIGKMKDNADIHLSKYERFFDASTYNKSRNAAYRLINSGSKAKKNFTPSDLQGLVNDSIDKLMYQEIKAWERQLGDHGIRHIVGNINMSNRIMNAMSNSGIRISNNDRFMTDVVMINHDLGYTTGESAASIPGTKFHKKFSKNWFDNEKEKYSKFFDNKELDRMSYYIENHDTLDINWDKDLLLSAISVSDNLAVFHDEKLPSLFKYVDGSIGILYDMQRALQVDDKNKFEKLKSDLDKVVDESKLPDYTKTWLKRASNEITDYTPKATIPMLFGKVQGFNYSKDDGLVVDVDEDLFDDTVAEFFDMGQKAYVKIAESYGVNLKDNDNIIFEKNGKKLLNIRIKREPKANKLEKAQEGLIPKKVTVHRGNKVFQQIFWVKPTGPLPVKNKKYKDFVNMDYNRILSNNKSIKSMIDDMDEEMSADREKNMGKEFRSRGFWMINDWAEGKMFKIVGIRAIASKMRGQEINRDFIKSLFRSVTGKDVDESTIDLAMSIGMLSMKDFPETKEQQKEFAEKGPTYNKAIETLKKEQEYAVKRTKELFGDEITLYRGIYGPHSKSLKEALKLTRETNKKIEIEAFPLSSYSQDMIAALSFVQDKNDGIVIERKVKAEDVSFAWYSNPAFINYFAEQKEVVISPKETSFEITNDDVVWQ